MSNDDADPAAADPAAVDAIAVNALPDTVAEHPVAAFADPVAAIAAQQSVFKPEPASGRVTNTATQFALKGQRGPAAKPPAK